MKQYEISYYKRANEKGNWDLFPKKEILQFINDRFVIGEKLLSVGCGTGEIIEYLPKEMIYTGIDISDLALKLAKEKHSSINTRFIKGEESHINLPDNGQDYVVSFYAIEHMKYPMEILKEMARVLKPGGHLIIVGPNLEFPFSSINSIRHKKWIIRLGFYIKRIKDYFCRLLGVYNFRTIGKSYTEETGKYEKIDDDLTYIVSSFEVINFLKYKCNFSPISLNKFKAGSKMKDHIKKIITYLPGFNYFGSVLFIIMRKN